MVLGCSTLGCTVDRYPKIADACGKLRSLGFDGVDLALFHGWQHISPAEIAAHPKAWAGRIGEITHRLGVRVLSVNCGMSASITDTGDAERKRYDTELKAVLALARSIDCPNVTINPGPQKPMQDEALDTLALRLSELADRARDVSVTLSLEGHEGSILEDPSVAGTFIAAQWPSVGFTFDPSHMIMQGYDPFAYPDLLSRSHHLHIRNAARGAMQTEADTGTLDIKGFFQAVKASDYAGNISVEYFNDFDPDFTSTIAIKKIWETIAE